MAGGIGAIRARIETLRADNERLENEVDDLRSTVAKERAEREQVNYLENDISQNEGIFFQKKVFWTDQNLHFLILGRKRDSITHPKTAIGRRWTWKSRGKVEGLQRETERSRKL